MCEKRGAEKIDTEICSYRTPNHAVPWRKGKRSSSPPHASVWLVPARSLARTFVRTASTEGDDYVRARVRVMHLVKLSHVFVFVVVGRSVDRASTYDMVGWKSASSREAAAVLVVAMLAAPLPLATTKVDYSSYQVLRIQPEGVNRDWLAGKLEKLGM